MQKKTLLIANWKASLMLMCIYQVLASACHTPATPQQRYLQSFNEFTQTVKAYCGTWEGNDFAKLDRQFHELSVLEYQQMRSLLSEQQQSMVWEYRAAYLDCRLPFDVDFPKPSLEPAPPSTVEAKRVLSISLNAAPVAGYFPHHSNLGL